MEVEMERHWTFFRFFKSIKLKWTGVQGVKYYPIYTTKYHQKNDRTGLGHKAAADALIFELLQ